MIHLLDKIFHYLQDHPLIGLFTSVGSGVIGLSAQKHPTLNAAIGGDHQWIDTITPYLSFFALGVGAAVGVLTMILKYLQIKEKIRNKNKDEE